MKINKKIKKLKLYALPIYENKYICFRKEINKKNFEELILNLGNKEIIFL